MTPDPKIYNRSPAPRNQRESELYGTRGGQTYDEACALREQGWRLLAGAEPSLTAPSPLLRYGPYETEGAARKPFDPR